MKRFHVHVAVGHLDEGIAFCSKLFGDPATVHKADNAKWMVEDPRLDFAISSRGATPGVNHLEIQLDTDEDLKAMHGRLVATDAGLVEEMGANCCYAVSDRHWITDPAGIAWETYRTPGSIPMYGGDGPDARRVPQTTATAAGCCAPATTAATANARCATRPAGTSAGTTVKSRAGWCS
jgi:hypothetical protein